MKQNQKKNEHKECIEEQDKFTEGLKEQSKHKLTEKSMEPFVEKSMTDVESGLMVEEHDFSRHKKEHM